MRSEAPRLLISWFPAPALARLRTARPVRLTSDLSGPTGSKTTGTSASAYPCPLMAYLIRFEEAGKPATLLCVAGLPNYTAFHPPDTVHLHAVRYIWKQIRAFIQRSSRPNAALYCQRMASLNIFRYYTEFLPGFSPECVVNIYSMAVYYHLHRWGGLCLHLPRHALPRLAADRNIEFYIASHSCCVTAVDYEYEKLS